MKFYKDIDKSVAFIKSRIRSEDVFYHEIKAGEKRAVVIYVDSITDKKSLGQMLINPLTKGEMKTLDDVKKCSFAAACVSEPNPLKAMEELVKGKCVLLFEGEKAALCFDFVHFETRAISEPPTSTVMKGPREGFNESLRVNLCLMYRRIKVSDFVVERFTLGRYSKTSVAVCYISSITDPKVVEEVKKRLKLIDIDGVPDSSYIGKMIVEHKTSLFKQVGEHGKNRARSVDADCGVFAGGVRFGSTFSFAAYTAQLFAYDSEQYKGHTSVAQFRNVFHLAHFRNIKRGEHSYAQIRGHGSFYCGRAGFGRYRGESRHSFNAYHNDNGAFWHMPLHRARAC